MWGKNIKIYTQLDQGEEWLKQYQGCLPIFACVLGFTETALIPGISTAGATPEDRKSTAIADAEFLLKGSNPHPQYPLPPLEVGISPVFISRAVLAGFNLQPYLFNAGLLQPPSVPAIDLGGVPAHCLTTGHALPLSVVKTLFQEGLTWGKKLVENRGKTYVILGECVVGGTTTALSILTGLGIDATGKVNSSHPCCNHRQKWEVVQQGLNHARSIHNPLALIAAVGDPMQGVVAGMAIAASHTHGVILAGGTQMLAVYALIEALAAYYHLDFNPKQIVVGTTRWVAEDPTGDTVGLAQDIGHVPLLATQLNFSTSQYAQLQCYEQGYVKEGVGAGGCAIASHLYQNWTNGRLLTAIEQLVQHNFPDS